MKQEVTEFDPTKLKADLSNMKTHMSILYVQNNFSYKVAKTRLDKTCGKLRIRCVKSQPSRDQVEYFGGFGRKTVKMYTVIWINWYKIWSRGVKNNKISHFFQNGKIEKQF